MECGGDALDLVERNAARIPEDEGVVQLEHRVAPFVLSTWEGAMPACELCGNEYAHAFVVTMHGVMHTFDSFECAIQQLAPTCAHCNCRIIGHGVEASGVFYCCAHCARKSGITAVVDNA